MTNWERTRRRQEETRRRTRTPDYIRTRCYVIGCEKPARAGTEDGLGKYCRRHQEHLSRHGSALKGSYSAAVVNPYRRAALEWLLAHEDDFWVKNAVRSVEGLYQRAGRFEEAFRLRGLSPKERAKIHWARLRRHQVDPRLVVAVYLAIEMVIADDSQAVWTKEYKRIQAAKIVHRMASGTHKRWEQATSDPNRKIVTEVHVYPHSRGRVLRYIGRDLETAVESLAAHSLEVIHNFKQQGDDAGAFSARPYPKNFVARRRSV